MKDINGIPCYRATIDSEDAGMYVVSLVDEPAVEVDFLAFNKQKSLEFKVQDEEQRMCLGVVMRPNYPMYRRDESGFEYYIEYSPETIHQMCEKYFAELNINNVDTNHSFELIDGVTLVQAFFKDVEKGINPVGFEDLPDDTLFFQYHITNDEIWEGVKDGTWKGFSLAGYFNVEPIELKKNKKIENKKMSKLNKIREALQNILAQFERISTDKALIESSDDEIKIGSPVHGINDEGNTYNLEDGEYKTEDGITYVINEGKVSDIVEEEISEDTGDDVEPENEQNFSLIHRMAVAFESFREKEDKIRTAIASKGIDGWLVEAGEDFVIIGVWQEASMVDKFFKYGVSWDAEGNAIIGDGVEVKSEFVPVDEKPVEEKPAEEKPEEFEEEEPEDKDEKIKNLEAEVARLEQENGELKERIKELEEKPAAEPASQEFEKVNKTEKTGIKRLDNLSRILNA